MADSPAFNPPVSKVPDNDPMIIRVPLDRMDMSARKSAQPPINSQDMTLSHIPNGQ